MKRKSKNQSKNKTLNFLRYLGPGLLVTVGFIDPGNWASNIAAGSGFGYELLWMVTLSTVMLIVLQHNAAHLGIATGLCLSEAASRYMPRLLKDLILLTAMLAAVATAMAEILGGAIALQMLFHIPIRLGSILILVLVLFFAFTNAYKRIEKLIILFVSLIGFSFLFEVGIAKIDWGMPGRAILNPFMKKVKELGRIAPAHCFQCLKHCNPGTTPYCITQALINAAKGKIDDALLFCGAYAYQATHLETVKEVIDSLIPERV